MKAVEVVIRASDIVDHHSFHSVFRNAFGFPEFYGRNMNAWIDCLMSLDDPDSGMTSPSIRPGEIVVLRIEGANDLKDRCPDEYDDLITCAAHVNYARVSSGHAPILALMLIDDEPRI